MILLLSKPFNNLTEMSEIPFLGPLSLSLSLLGPQQVTALDPRESLDVKLQRTGASQVGLGLKGPYLLMSCLRWGGQQK